MSATDSDLVRLNYEAAVKADPSNVEAVEYLGIWHLERHNFQQAKKYFDHLVTLRPEDGEIRLCLSVCCAIAGDFKECHIALEDAQKLLHVNEDDVRIRFCFALLAEKQKDFTTAMDGYVKCLNYCMSAKVETDAASQDKFNFFKELRGEIMLRVAVLKKEMGAVDQSMNMCNNIINATETFGDSIKANALCLKGLLTEMKNNFPESEVVYRNVLQLRSGHSTALERLGRVYLRYRETIPAAVQCFFKSVETNPSNHVAWYLLGRCYMATAQYSDACEAYNRAVNLNPNDPQVWCSLGVLYYAFGQYREALGMLARALKIDPTMADAWYNVAALYDMCDQPEDAQQAYAKAHENGLSERLSKAGIGLNPQAAQSLQHLNSTAAHDVAVANSIARTGSKFSGGSKKSQLQKNIAKTVTQTKSTQQHQNLHKNRQYQVVQEQQRISQQQLYQQQQLQEQLYQQQFNQSQSHSHYIPYSGHPLINGAPPPHISMPEALHHQPQHEQQLHHHHQQFDPSSLVNGVQYSHSKG